MVAWVALGIVCCGAVMLLKSAWDYRGRHIQFQAVLIAHGVIPFAAVRPAASAWPCVEVGLGSSTLLAVLAAISTETHWPYHLGAVLMSVVFLGLAVYLCVAWTRTGGAPCGCFADDRSIGWWVISRALVVSAGAAYASISGLDVSLR